VLRSEQISWCKSCVRFHNPCYISFGVFITRYVFWHFSHQNSSFSIVITIYASVIFNATMGRRPDDVVLNAGKRIPVAVRVYTDISTCRTGVLGNSAYISRLNRFGFI
jgi:hypothetical protein